MSEDFGPREVDVAAFLRRLGRVNLDEARALAAFWQGADPTQRAAAWRAVEAAARSSGRSAALDAARRAVTGWAQRGQGWAWGTQGLEGVPQGEVFRETWGRAAPPALDAVAALVVRDLLPADVFETLWGPWAAVMGEEAA